MQLRGSAHTSAMSLRTWTPGPTPALRPITMGFITIVSTQIKNVVRTYVNLVTEEVEGGGTITREEMITRIEQEVIQITNTEYIPEPVRQEIERQVDLAIQEGRLGTLDPRAVAEQSLAAVDTFEGG